MQPPVPARRQRFLAGTPRPVEPIDLAEPVDVVQPVVPGPVLRGRGRGHGGRRAAVPANNAVQPPRPGSRGRRAVILPAVAVAVIEDPVPAAHEPVVSTQLESSVRNQRLRRRPATLSPNGDYVFPPQSRRTRLG